MSPSSSQGSGTLNIRVSAQIDGKNLDLQFHSAEISQGLHELCTIRLELGFDEVKTDDVFKKAQDWMGASLSLTIADIANKDVPSSIGVGGRQAGGGSVKAPHRYR